LDYAFQDLQGEHSYTDELLFHRLWKNSLSAQGSSFTSNFSIEEAWKALHFIFVQKKHAVIS